jgi:MFS family permease
MLALPPLGVIFSQYPIGALSDRYDRRRVLTVAAFAAAILALVAIPAAAYSQTSLIALYTAFGAISIPIYALALAHANDHLQRDQMLGASSKLVLVYGSGAIAGPSLAGGGMTELGPQGFMTYMIVVYGGLGLFAVYRMMRRAAPSPTEGARLPQVVPTTTPVAAAAIAEEMGESLSK